MTALTLQTFEEARDLIAEAATERFAEIIVRHPGIPDGTRDALFATYLTGFAAGALWITENHAH